MKNIVIFGATSAIAEHLARLYAAEGARLFLAARDLNKLARIQQDLLIRGAAEVQTERFDATEHAANATLTEKAFTSLSHVDLFIVCHGHLPDQTGCQSCYQKTLDDIELNGASVITLLTTAANNMENQGSGTLAAITSVAGDRGRQSNYVYGAAKGMVSIFLQGLGQRLAKAGVHVLDVKPGFVDTPMTETFTKGPLWSTPDQIAALIKKRVERGSSFSYAPSWWALIITVIRLIPASLFNRLSL